jgi:raffinose synthase
MDIQTNVIQMIAAHKIFLEGFVFPLLLVFSSSQAQVSFNRSGGSLTIYTGKMQRLTGGIGLIDGTQNQNIKTAIRNDVALFELNTPGASDTNGFAGVFFNNIPQLKHGITIWRYKPWNSWTKPILVTDATKMQDWDVQFFYWQYEDGTYGAAVPLSGNGFRTTLGSLGNKWGSKAVSYAKNSSKAIPSMAIAFGKHPYELFSRIYRTALEAMGKGENEFYKKTLPGPLQYIGWCTWNSSNMGRDLNEEHILEGVKSFTEKGFPLGWVLVDDGWFQNDHSRLQSLKPDPEKFPNGFKPLIQKLKGQYSVRYAGIWHAFDGYWNGIDPNSRLGKEYQDQLFSWDQKESVDNNSSPTATYYFIKPEGDNLFRFYDRWHQYFKAEGFDFVKVDNQLVAERMAVNNYPLFNLSVKMHNALYQSVNKNFKGAILNCMDMTADAYLNFGSSATARTVEDYFPYDEHETYNLQRGNAAAHVLQAIYNSIYFSQMVFTDYDMFQSHNPNAVMHALARTLNNGPIYLTDKPGEQNFDILNRIVYSDGRSIRSGTSLLPSEDCLLQLQDAKLFKAFSRVGSAGLLALFNLADADKVEGSVKASDVVGLKGAEFVLYDYFSGKLNITNKTQSFDVSLPRMGYGLYYVVPVKNDFAAFGLTNKYNAPATILSQSWQGRSVDIQLYEGGLFKAYSANRPRRVMVNKKACQFSYVDRIINIDVPVAIKKPLIEIAW